MLLNEHVTALIKQSGDTQMTAEEYTHIGQQLGSVNFLVFGTGRDSPMWNELNAGGTTIFLEHDDRWIKPEYGSNVYKVIYTSKLADSDKLLDQYKSGNYDYLYPHIACEVSNIDWDVILVDSPGGYSNRTPGRMQSIFAAQQLANSNTKIYVHDCDRPVEDVWTTELFDVKKQFTKLRECSIKTNI